MRALLLVLVALLSLGCQADSIDQHGLTVLNEKWALPPQKPISIGFWGSSAMVRVYKQVDSQRPEQDASITVSADTDASEYSSMWPRAVSMIKNPETRGFIRMIPRYLIGIRPGSGNPPKLSGSAKGSAEPYWVEESLPKIDSGWRVISKKIRNESLPLIYTGKGCSGGAVNAKFELSKIKWDLSKIDVPLDRDFLIGFDDAWKSPYSLKSLDRDSKIAPKDHYQMRPLVFVKVATYVLQNDSTGAKRTEEILTGWIEAAGDFNQEV